MFNLETIEMEDIFNFQKDYVSHFDVNVEFVGF